MLDVFEVKGTYNPTTEKVTAAPKEFTAATNQQGEDEYDDLAMASMDIFAGCGGLSEGMHQAKVAVSKWAIEYEKPAADAFQLNNPDAAVFCNNCNVILLVRRVLMILGVIILTTCAMEQVLGQHSPAVLAS